MSNAVAVFHDHEDDTFLWGDPDTPLRDCHLVALFNPVGRTLQEIVLPPADGLVAFYTCVDQARNQAQCMLPVCDLCLQPANKPLFCPVCEQHKKKQVCGCGKAYATIALANTYPLLSRLCCQACAEATPPKQVAP